MKNLSTKKVLVPESTPEDSLRRTSIRRIVVLFVLLAVLIFLNSGSSFLPTRLCPWFNLTGTDCPFCGLTRSVIATGDLHFHQAFALHPFGPAVTVLLALWLAVSILRVITGKPGEMGPTARKIIMFCVVPVWLAWWVLARLI